MSYGGGKMSNYFNYYDRLEDDDDRSEFYDPWGRSALRAGERKHRCPNCGKENALTDADLKLGYQCDICADRLEGPFIYGVPMDEY
jgi:hypothetical protein